MALLHQTKNISGLLHFLPVGYLGKKMKMVQSSGYSGYFPNCHWLSFFFFFPAHKLEPEVIMSGLSFMSLSSLFWNPGTAFLAWIMSFCTYTSYRIKLTPFYPILCSFIPHFLRALCFTGRTVNSFRALLVFVFLPCLLQASQLIERSLCLPVSHGETLVTFCPSRYPSCILHSNCPVKKNSRYKSIFCLYFSFLGCFSDHSLFWGDVFSGLLKLKAAHSFHTQCLFLPRETEIF